MTETRSVSIEEVRALVAERQRYDDWLTALEARRADTPAHVFDRVHADYAGRRRGVMVNLRQHVSGLSASANDLEERLTSLESRLGALEDERAEAMLRTAVGEFDADRWEQVRQDVESQIAGLGEQRSALLSEVDEVKTLLASASSEPDPELEVVPEAELAVEAPAQGEAVADVAAQADHAQADQGQAEQEHGDVFPLSDMVSDADANRVSASTEASVSPTVEPELAGLDHSLAMFTSDPAPDSYSAPSAPPVVSPSLDGLDVFDDAELGDLRMTPPARSTATVTPPSANRVDARAETRMTDAPSTHDAAVARDGFDDLAFLRSVVDPSSAGGSRATSGGEQQKTLRCTECGTMNLPTEWYCERCGGELAAF